MFDAEPERYWEIALKESAHVIVTRMACLRRSPNVLIICGSHNKVLAEYIMLESQRVGARPQLCTFDEGFYLKSLKDGSEHSGKAVLNHTLSLVEKSDTVIWLSQFEDTQKLPANIRKAAYAFWDSVSEAAKSKPRLLVNLPSPKYIRAIGINYLEFLAAFINGVKVDYNELRKTGSKIASKLAEKQTIQVCHTNGTDLKFSIRNRRAAVEAGTLEECYATGRECCADVPAGEMYIAPVETSADGAVVVDKLSDYGMRGLELRFKNGRIVDFKAEKGEGTFRKLLKEAEGDKDRIAEFGVGTNRGLKPVGWSIYDEKALGTAHIGIGNNVHLGGVNRASIHLDFVLRNPTIRVDNEALMEEGKLVE